MQFVDRFLKCLDCGNEFVFTAGEQIFFYDKQFKNDPKRCKLCKAKRAGTAKPGNSNGAAALPLSRTETRAECSTCGIETTVPFKPTQGRPVLCRACFQMKRVPSAVAAVMNLDSAAAKVEAAEAAMEASFGAEAGGVGSAGGLATGMDSPPPCSCEATMEMIAATPGAILSESENAEAMAKGVEIGQA